MQRLHHWKSYLNQGDQAWHREKSHRLGSGLDSWAHLDWVDTTGHHPALSLLAANPPRRPHRFAPREMYASFHSRNASSHVYALGPALHPHSWPVLQREKHITVYI